MHYLYYIRIRMGRDGTESVVEGPTKVRSDTWAKMERPLPGSGDRLKAWAVTDDASPVEYERQAEEAQRDGRPHWLDPDTREKLRDAMR